MPCPGCRHNVHRCNRVAGNLVCRFCYIKAKYPDGCTQCHARIGSLRSRDGRCRGCIAKARGAQKCIQCGRLSVCETRTPPRCARCTHGKPRTTCAQCARSVQSSDVWLLEGRRLCRECYRTAVPDARCSRCGWVDRLFLRAGHYWCHGCTRARRREHVGPCATCGQVVRSLVGGRCYKCRPRRALRAPRQQAIHVCYACGATGARQRGGRCERCKIEQYLRTKLGDAQGMIAPRLMPFIAFLSRGSLTAVRQWVDHLADDLRACLTDVAAGRCELSNSLLAELGSRADVRWVRRSLVAAGALIPNRIDSTLTEAWLRDAVCTQLAPGDGLLLRTYLRLHAVPSANDRAKRGMRVDPDLRGFRYIARVACEFMVFLAEQDTTLASCTRASFDSFTETRARSVYRSLVTFLRWAWRQGSCRFRVQHAPQGGGIRIVALQSALESRLQDACIPASLRVAAGLVGYYGLPCTAIVKLRHCDVREEAEDLLLRNSAGRWIPLFPPISEALRALLAQTTTWLFPNQQRPYVPIGSASLRVRLHRSGVITEDLGHLRYAAVLRWYRALPAPFVMRAMGWHRSTAINARAHVASPEDASYVGLRIAASLEASRERLDLKELRRDNAQRLRKSLDIY